jgi:hypothetical protein
MPVAASSAASAASLVAHLPAASAGPPWWSQGIWPDLIKGLPAAIVALLVGGLAAMIAWRQARIAGAKLKLDLFDKRLKVFDAVWALLAASPIKPEEDASLVAAFYEQLPKAAFLFDANVRDYVETVRAKLQQLHHAAASISAHEDSRPPSLPPEEAQSFGRELARLTLAMQDLQAWFMDQADPCRDVFATHLTFGDWR